MANSKEREKKMSKLDKLLPEVKIIDGWPCSWCGSPDPKVIKKELLKLIIIDAILSLVLGYVAWLVVQHIIWSVLK